MSWFFIEPSDVLFFRDSRPFGAGDDHLATSIFPPNPKTMAGAFRSLLLGNSEVDWNDFRYSKPSAEKIQAVIGTPKGILDSKFSMSGPFLASHIGSKFNIHTRLPFDTSFLDEQEHSFCSYRPSQDQYFEANWPQSGLHSLWPADGKKHDKPKERFWVNADHIDRYRNGIAFNGIPESNILQFESRVGLARNQTTRTALDQHLYSASFIRMKTKYGFAVKLNDEFDMLPSTGYLILGGEAKAAKYTRLQSDIPFSFGLAESKKRFKVVLITPAFFSSGWEPDAGNWSDVLGFPAKIIAASLGKPLYLGGYDVANHRQRAIQSFVAPGSVYYFETSEPIRQLKRPFTESPSPEMPLERLGYGQAFLGHWDWQSLQEVK